MEIPTVQPLEEAPPPIPPRPPEVSYAEDEEERVPCPYCSEKILSSAKKCKWCGEVLDRRMRMAERTRGRIADRAAAGQTRDPGPDAMDWILIFVCPGIACIIGVVALLRGQSRRGGIMLLVSLLWGFVVNLVLAAGRVRR